jgi:hypothetical protein
LELLLRKSFDIVEVYQIPNEKDLAIIGACLQESVPSGQNIVRSSLKSGIFPYEKPADFMQVLGKIEPLMHDTLMNNWHEAACFQANQVPARLN